MPTALSTTTCAISSVKSGELDAYVALLGKNDRQEPNACVLTVGTEAVIGALSVDVSVVFEGVATDTKMAPGQPLQWIDPATDLVYLTYVSAEYTGGVSLSIRLNDEVLPVGAQAIFPVKMGLRGDIQTSSTTAVIETNTLDHAIADAAPGTRTLTNNLPGLWNHYCAGCATLEAAEGNKDGQEIFITIVYPSPSSNAADFPVKPARKGIFFVTGTTEGAPNDSNVSFDATGRYVDFKRIRAAAA